MPNTFGQIAQNGVMLELEPSPTPVKDNNGRTVSRLVVSIGDGGSGGGPAVAPANIAPGPANLATNQVAMTATAAAILAARTGAVGVGRVAAAIYNAGLNSIWLGGAAVTTATGMELKPGGSAQVDTTAAVYGICAATLTSTAEFMETY